MEQLWRVYAFNWGKRFPSLVPAAPGSGSSSSAPLYPSVSSTSSGGGSSSRSSSPQVNTSGLSGYALQYANAINSGASDAQAHSRATQAMGGSGLTINDIAKILSGSSPDLVQKNASQLKFNPNTGMALNGYETPEMLQPKPLPQLPLPQPLSFPIPQVPQVPTLEYKPWQPNANLRLSSGGETVIPTLAGQNQFFNQQRNIMLDDYGRQTDLYNRQMQAQQMEQARLKAEADTVYRNAQTDIEREKLALAQRAQEWQMSQPRTGSVTDARNSNVADATNSVMTRVNDLLSGGQLSSEQVFNQVRKELLTNLGQLGISLNDAKAILSQLEPMYIPQESKMSSVDRRNEARAAAFEWANRAMDEGYDADALLGLLYENAGAFVRDGVDPKELESYIIQRFMYK